MDAAIAAFKALAAYDKTCTGGVIAETIARDEKDACLIHDLKVFANVEAMSVWASEIRRTGSPL